MTKTTESINGLQERQQSSAAHRRSGQSFRQHALRRGPTLPCRVVGEDSAHLPAPRAHRRHRHSARRRSCRGVRGIITGADVKGVMVGLRMKDMPLLAHDKVRYAGEPVAAVAADTDEIAEEALNLIDVQYEALPFVTDPVEATAARRAGAARRSDVLQKCARSATSTCPTCSPTANGPTAMSTPAFKRPRGFSNIPFARRWDFTATSSPTPARCRFTTTADRDLGVEQSAIHTARSFCPRCRRRRSESQSSHSSRRRRFRRQDFGRRGADLLFSRQENRQSGAHGPGIHRGSHRDLAPPSGGDHAAHRRRRRQQDLRPGDQSGF